MLGRSLLSLSALCLLACGVEVSSSAEPEKELVQIVTYDGPYGGRIVLVDAEGNETEVDEDDPRLEAARRAPQQAEAYGESRAPLLAPTHTDNKTVRVCAENMPNYDSIMDYPLVDHALAYSGLVGVNVRIDNRYFATGSPCRDTYDIKYKIQNIACRNCGVDEPCWFASTACGAGSGKRHNQCLIDISLGCMNKYVETHYPAVNWTKRKSSLYNWTSLHEYGHALGLQHFSSSCSDKLDTVMSYCSPHSLFAFNAGEIADLKTVITDDAEL
jgi:hypothetical protein